MQNKSILGKVVLAYCPFILRDQSIAATRLSVLPLSAREPLAASELVDVVAETWPRKEAAVCLGVSSEALVKDLLRSGAPGHVMLEVPNFMAADADCKDAITMAHRGGNTLLLGGRPNSELPRDVLQCFSHTVLDFWDDRRIGDNRPAPDAHPRRITTVHSGIRSRVEMQASFASGSHAVVGWPIDGRSKSTGLAPRPPLAPETDIMIVAELIRQVRRGDDIALLETTLKQDPALAFRLLRHMNSAAFGLRLQVSSFRHAIMLLGYKQLGRWLALLLATASQDANLRPIMFASVRRGLLMEELFPAGDDQETRDEIFMCGVFSLLDCIFDESMDKLLENIPVPERIEQALVHQGGPFAPYLDMARAVENAAIEPFREAADRMLASVAEVNRATLRSLQRADLVE